MNLFDSMPFLQDILACTFERWTPKIGDPGVMGWFTVTAYSLTALAGIICSRRARANSWHPFMQKEAGFWLLFVLLYSALGINKQLDLQSGMTAVGRCVSQLEGWYEQRRAFQIWFVLAFAAISLLLSLICIIVFRAILSRVWISIVGIGLTMCFVVVRSVGFHDFDAILEYSVNGIRMNWVLELSGIALAGCGAVLAARRLVRRPGISEPC